MDALGVVMMSAGAFIVYAAVKGEHPWSLFVSTLNGSAAAGPSVAAQVANPQAGQAATGIVVPAKGVDTGTYNGYSY